MAITTQRVKGRRITVALGELGISQWDKISIARSVEIENPQSAAGTFKEKILDVTDIKATISGFLGAGSNVANLPDVGDEVVLDFSIDETNSMFKTDWLDTAASGKWRVVSVDYDGSKDSSKWSITVEAGFID